MVRHQRQIRGSQVSEANGENVSYEQHESSDDNLLPDSTELSRLKALDPLVIDWIKERAEKEQDARLDFNTRKLALIERGQKMAFRIDLIAILCAFVITMTGMLLSYLLIQANQIVTGTIFGGATIVFAANAFLSIHRKEKAPKNTIQ